jgi:calcineurin-like phosphoesterase family protein
VREPASLSLHGHVHSATLDDTRFINVSAEVIGFRPRNLDELITERIERVFKALPGGDRAGADL